MAKKAKAPKLAGKIQVGRRPSAGAMADRRSKRTKTRATRKARALRDW